MNQIENSLKGRAGRIIGTVWFYGERVIDNLRGVIYKFPLTPLGATVSFIENRHEMSATGQSLREVLKSQGLTDRQISGFERRIRKQCGNYILVGYAGTEFSQYDRVWAEADGNPDTPVKYYLGMENLVKNKSTTWNEIISMLRVN